MSNIVGMCLRQVEYFTKKSSVMIRNGESMISEKWKIDKSYKDTCIELLYENLVSLRAKANITQAEIANLVGISRQTYYAIESGQRTMSWNTYLSLLLFFDTNNFTRSMLRDLNIYPKELMIKMCGV